jgi:hypothetical protein
MKGMPLLCAVLLGASVAQSADRPTLVLEGKAARLVVDLKGGSIADFHLVDHQLNPLSWDSADFGDTSAIRSMGHFLCLDRWGPASEAERANGMGWHGEASRVEWKVAQKASKEKGTIRAALSAVLPMAGLSVRRTIEMAEGAAFFAVHEAVANDRPLGRIYNMVQHPTIGPPFLDEHTLVDANARKGFAQGGNLPNPEEPSFYWPQALTRNGLPVNLRHLEADHEPNVCSYVIEEEHGWTTATSPTTGLLIGYLWKRQDYPWFDAWRHVKDGRPFARGLEFGTTGLHQPFPMLVEKGKIFDRHIFVHLDAGQTQTRSYACFLMKVAQDFAGVGSLSYEEGRLTLFERGGQGRELSLVVGELWGL